MWEPHGIRQGSGLPWKAAVSVGVINMLPTTIISIPSNAFFNGRAPHPHRNGTDSDYTSPHAPVEIV